MSLNIVAQLRSRIDAVIRSLWPAVALPQFAVSEPDIPEHGDLATNVALLLAGQLKQSPLKIAQELARRLSSDWFTSQIAKPGFINFHLNHEHLINKLGEYIISLRDVESRGGKIVLEHTNVNPNKAMHVGHLRNAILGDAIRRILERVGFAVEVQYYVDDTGVQVADTFVGITELQLQQKKEEKFDHFCWRVYVAVSAAYESNPALLAKRASVLHELETPGSAVAGKVKEMAGRILDDHLLSMARFNIDYHLLVWESDIIGSHFWDRAFELLKKQKLTIRETAGKNAGCWVIKSEIQAGDEEHTLDKILVKSDGILTYTAKDIAYHFWKFGLLGDADFTYKNYSEEKKASAWHKTLAYGLWSTAPRGKRASRSFGKANRVYNVIDVRQAYPQSVIKSVFERLGGIYADAAKNLKHVAYGIVSLSKATVKHLGVEVAEDREVYSMSGRKGIGVPADTLLAQVQEAVQKQTHTVTSKRHSAAVGSASVAVGAIKYFMLRYNPQSTIVFDLKEALSLEGNTGPYVQYAHARAAGILEKAGETGTPKGQDLAPEERALISKLYLWPQVIADVASDLQINRITNYAFELADRFNAFYEACPVLKASSEDLRSQRLALVSAYKQVLGDVLHILGIEAPEKM